MRVGFLPVIASMIWLAGFPGPAAAYLECHQGAYSEICAEVGDPSSSGGGTSGGSGQTPDIPKTEEEIEDEQMLALIDSAEALLARGKFDTALREVEEALALRPGDVEATALRSRIRLSAGYADPSLVPVAAASVEPSSTSIVDARGQTVDLRLPVPEQMQNSPALGEWRKGMDAVLRRDWQLAAAWFKQGLNKDPANDALLRAAELADWTLQQRQQEAAAGGALRLIDQAFEARDAGDRQRHDAILALIRNDPHYQDPDAQRWRDLVFQHLEERSLAGGPKPVAQMSEEEKTELFAARLMGEALAEDAERIGDSALLAGRPAEAKVAFQAAAALAPHIPYYRRAAEALDQTQ